MFEVVERDGSGNERVLCVKRDFLSARDRAEALNEDMEDNGCTYFARARK